MKSLRSGGLNVPQIPDRRREIKWIWKERFENAFGEESAGPAVSGAPVPLLCNHCEHPACVKVCPTGATWKRESDGLVTMDEHRCIGCRYCMAACPYGSRSFNWSDPRPFLRVIDAGYPTRTKGVVEKCTFCAERLARGGQPACVEVCPPKAMVFGDAADPVLGGGAASPGAARVPPQARVGRRAKRLLPALEAA